MTTRGGFGRTAFSAAGPAGPVDPTAPAARAEHGGELSFRSEIPGGQGEFVLAASAAKLHR